MSMANDENCSPAIIASGNGTEAPIDDDAEASTSSSSNSNNFSDVEVHPFGWTSPDPICVLINLCNEWKAKDQNSEELAALQLLIVCMIGRKSNSRKAWHDLEPHTRQIVIDWVQTAICDEPVNSDLATLAAHVVSDFENDEGFWLSFDTASFMQVLSNLLKTSDPVKHFRAVTMYSCFVESLVPTASDLETAMGLLKEFLMTSYIMESSSEEDTRSKCISISILTSIVEKLDERIQVHDYGLLTMAVNILDNIGQINQEDLVVQIMNLLQAGATKFNMTLDFQCRHIIPRIVRIGLRNNVSQLTAITSAVTLEKIFFSGRGADVMEKAGSKIVELVLSLIIRGLEEGQGAGIIKIYELQEQSEYLKAGVKLLASLTSQPKTLKYLLLTTEKLFRTPPPHHAHVPTGWEKTSYWKYAVFLLLGYCINYIAHVPQHESLFPQVMARIMQFKTEEDPLARECGWLAITELMCTVGAKNLVRPFMETIVKEIQSSLEDITSEAHSLPLYWELTFKRRLIALRLAVVTDEFKRIAVPFIVDFGQKLKFTQSKVTKIYSLNILATLVTHGKEAVTGSEYNNIVKYLNLKGHKIDSTMSQDDFIICSNIFNLLEALTRTMPERSKPHIHEFFDYACQALVSIKKPLVRKSVFSWFGSVNGQLALLLGKQDYLELLEHIIRGLAGDRQPSKSPSPVHDSGITLTPPTPINNASSMSRTQDDLMRGIEELQIDATSEFRYETKEDTYYIDEFFPPEGLDHQETDDEWKDCVDEKIQAIESILQCLLHVSSWIKSHTLMQFLESIATVLSQAPGLRLKICAVDSVAQCCKYVHNFACSTKDDPNALVVCKKLFELAAKIARGVCAASHQPAAARTSVFRCMETLLLVFGPNVFQAEPELKDDIRTMMTSTFVCFNNFVTDLESPLYSKVKTQNDLREMDLIKTLMETVVDLIEVFGDCIPAQEFESLFADIVQAFEKRMNDYCASLYDDAIWSLERETISGIFGESMRLLKTNVSSHISRVHDFLCRAVKDSADSVRNNAVFAFGEMMKHCQGAVAEQFDTILYSCLLERIGDERHPRVKENIVCALAKTVPAFFDFMSPMHVLPVIIQNLPLRADLMEYDAILDCLFFVLNRNATLLQDDMFKIIVTAGELVKRKAELDCRGKCDKSDKIIKKAQALIVSVSGNYYDN